MKPPYAIGSVPSLSGHAIAYRWRLLPRVRRHRASKHQGSSERVLPWQVTMDQLIFASLSHTHYWFEVGMLKVPADIYMYITPVSRPISYSSCCHKCKITYSIKCEIQTIMGRLDNSKKTCIDFKEKSERIYCRPSEHALVRGGGGGGDVKTFRWDHRLQRQKPLHGVQSGSPMVVTLGQ